MIGEMIGSKSSKGAVVYGIYSFFDKIANGLIIYFIMVSFLILFFHKNSIPNNLLIKMLNS